jgi:type I restriction enzyme S subunit
MKEGWEYKKLKEVGLTQTGTTPSKQIKSFYGGDIPFIRPAELNIDQNGGILYESELKLTEEGALKARVIKEKSVLMCCIGSVGKTGFTLRSVTCNQQINTITPYDNYNPKFVYYALISPSFQQEVTKIANSAKATLPIISKGKWEVLSIPIPPLSEQQTIVDYLDSAFAKIDAMKANAEKALNEAKALFQASLKEMLEPKEGWEEKKLGDVGTFIRGGNFSKKDFVEDGYPCIHYGQIHTKFGVATFEHLSCVPETMVKKERCASKGDLVIAITSEDDEGSCKCTAWMADYDAYVGGHTAIFKHNLNPIYVSYYFKAARFQKDKLDYTHGFKVVEISPKDIAKIPICYPSAEEQQSIVETLDSLKSKVDRLQENYNKISQECDALKQAILRQVFE